MKNGCRLSGWPAHRSCRIPVIETFQQLFALSRTPKVPIAHAWRGLIIVRLLAHEQPDGGAKAHAFPIEGCRENGGIGPPVRRQLAGFAAIAIETINPD